MRTKILVLAIILGVVVVTLWMVRNYYRPVSPEDIRELSGHLASLFDGKHSLAEAILIAAHRVRNPRLKSTLLRVRASFDTPEGRSKPFYELMANYPDVFPPEFTWALECASRMGKAGVLLKELSKSWPDDLKERKEVVARILKPMAIQTLKDKGWFYRLSAVYVLGNTYLSSKEFIPHLLPLLNDPDPRVQEATKKALDRLGYKVGE